MKVKELIEYLEMLPENKEISLFWDGAARGNVAGIVNHENPDLTSEVIIIGEWSIYRKGSYRAYDEDEIIYG